MNRINFILIVFLLLVACSRVEQNPPAVSVVSGNVIEVSGLEQSAEGKVATHPDNPAPLRSHKRAKSITLAKASQEESSSMIGISGGGPGEGPGDILDLLWDLSFTGVGFRAGASYSSISSSISSKPAPFAGVAGEMNVARIGDFALSVELNVAYLRRDIILQEGDISAEYLNVPVIGKLRWPYTLSKRMGSYQLFCGMGLDSNIMLASYFHYNTDNKDYRYDTNSCDAAGIINLGGEISMGSLGSLVGEFRYSYGLTPATSGKTMYFKNYGYENVTIREDRISGYTLMVGYNYRLRN